MTKRFFGTDGIRGEANKWPMNSETALQLGMAAGTYFRRKNHNNTVIIGKDTRRSGYMVEFALVSGFAAVGMDVKILGPIPTPAVGILTRSLRADLGVMISASHNGFADNGIKLFGSDGFKLTNEQEHEIEALLLNYESIQRAPPHQIGQVKSFEDSRGRYVEFAKFAFPRGARLDGLRVVIDCANGAAYKTAPWALFELGAEVVEIGVNPNGMNINDGCGSTDLGLLKKTVLERRADIGIALDGDADRIAIIDEKGNEIDGDQIIAAIASEMIKEKTLTGGAVVTTIMSNLGLERFIESKGAKLLRTDVGDRQVVMEMRQKNCNLGGEQSGHIIALDYATTGDGLISALLVLSAMVSQNKKASEVLNCFTPAPQILKNIRYSGASPLSNPKISAKLDAAKKDISDKGARLVIRTSGTEPLVRLMAEGEDIDFIKASIEELSHIVQNG
ncbi:MAG: phosphoglucosamine mutase [Caulobacterales bacterium]|nr:phosphoglucosamine mutase [Caulobacterales bacterium]